MVEQHIRFFFSLYLYIRILILIYLDANREIGLPYQLCAHLSYDRFGFYLQPKLYCYKRKTHAHTHVRQPCALVSIKQTARAY